MAKLSIFVILVFLISIGYAMLLRPFPLRCRRCDRARSEKDCEGWVDCSDDEVCFMDEIITPQLTKLYESGCRARDACSQAGKRQALPEIIACSKCCNTRDYCNEELCGIQRGTNQTICNRCGDPYGLHATNPVQFPEDCAHRSPCNTDEMCYASTHSVGEDELRHETQCMNKKVCQSLMGYILNTSTGSDTQNSNLPAIVGKRSSGSSSICAVCCGDDKCNRYACETVKSRLVMLHKYNSLNLTTLKEIY